MPIFNPKSEARWRGAGIVFCAAVSPAMNKKSVAMAKSLLVMSVVYGGIV